MSITDILRKNGFKIPPRLGIVIGRIPNRYKPFLGKLYQTRRQEIRMFDTLSDDQKKCFIFSRVKNIVDFAVANVSFYRDYYRQCGFSPEKLETFDDLERIPVISKKILLDYPLEYRTAECVAKKYVVNTGGSSGHPLSFYIEPSSTAHEWAHMFTIWEKLGYRSWNAKVHFAGRSDVKNAIEYDFARNSFEVDMYKPFDSYIHALEKIVRKYKCQYLHGYPSVLYDFAQYCRQHPESRAMLSQYFKGAFLGSEYPYAHFREEIERTFGLDTVSWYGHTERCVLAYEKNEKFRYNPFQTYGFTEVTGEGHLTGTSYYNRASPLIRYDTEDTVTDFQKEEGLLYSFRLENGRSGQFITDRQGKNISLTGLIFGRHHRLFDYCSHLQIQQQKPGEATILYVLNQKLPSDFDPANLFDTTNVQIDFSFKNLPEPIRTPAGKINILVKQLP